MTWDARRIAGALALAGTALAMSTPASAQAWRYGGWGYYRPVPPPPPPVRYAPRPAYYGGAHGYRTYRYRPCNSWWHWDSYVGRYVRVTNC